VEVQSITVPLNLPGVQVVSQHLTPTAIEVTVVRMARGATCPGCGWWTTKQHDARPRAKADEPLGDRLVTVRVMRRRFRCLGCDRVFTEPDAVAGPRRRLTARLRERLGQEAVRQPVAHIAERYGVSPTTMRRAVLDHATARLRQQPHAAVTRLGIDDFSLRRGQRYATGLHDLDGRRVIDVVEGRTSAAVVAALERLPAPEAVTAVSMDMSAAYRAAVHLVLPQAVITADKFHVIARVTAALAGVVTRLMKGRSRTDPVRRAARLVLRGHEHLDSAAWKRLTPLLRQTPDLRRAWLLKEDLRRWYRTATAATARLELRAWGRMLAEATTPPEMQALGSMLTGWGEEILSYFTTRVTQGVVEGKNHRAKVIQRQAYGYRNFANYRLRLLLAS
jgi:transposase